MSDGRTEATLNSKWLDRERNFSIRVQASTKKQEYNPIADSNNQSYFQIPSVMKHLRRLHGLVGQEHNPESVRLAKSLSKVIEREPTPKPKRSRGTIQRKVYVNDFDRDIHRLEDSIRKLDKPRKSRTVVRTEYDNEGFQVYEPVGESMQPVSTHLPPIHQPTAKTEPSQEIRPVQHNKLLDFFRNKKMEVYMRKVYLRGSIKKSH